MKRIAVLLAAATYVALLGVAWGDDCSAIKELPVRTPVYKCRNASMVIVAIAMVRPVAIQSPVGFSKVAANNDVAAFTTIVNAPSVLPTHSNETLVFSFKTPVCASYISAAYCLKRRYYGSPKEMSGMGLDISAASPAAFVAP